MTLSQHWLTPAGSPQPNPTLLSSVAQRLLLGTGRLTLNLEASRYTSPNCFFIKLTVSMKKPFLLPCFPSPAFSLSLSPSSSSYTSSVSLIRLRSRTEQSFGALRGRGAGLKWRFVLLCVCACVLHEKAHFMGGWGGGVIAELEETDDEGGMAVARWWPQ